MNVSETWVKAAYILIALLLVLGALAGIMTVV
jgi:hypothetical protein